MPTLIAACRGDTRVPFDEGRKLAAAIPGARFVPLESKNHVLLPDEPAWAVFHAELARFLGRGSAPGNRSAIREAGLTPAEAAVLDLVAEGLDNREIAARLGKSAKTVRNQILDRSSESRRAQPGAGNRGRAGRASTHEQQVASVRRPVGRASLARHADGGTPALSDRRGLASGRLPHAPRRQRPMMARGGCPPR